MLEIELHVATNFNGFVKRPISGYVEKKINNVRIIHLRGSLGRKAKLKKKQLKEGNITV